MIELGAQVGESLTMAQGQRAMDQLRDALAVVLAENYTPRSPVTAVAIRRRIDDLSPQDPIAADLALLREGIHELRARPVPAKVDMDDVYSLRDFVTGLVRDGALTEEQLGRLVTPGTSHSFDLWVDRLKAQLPVPPPASGGLSDDPWATERSSTRGGWSDEPPF